MKKILLLLAMAVLTLGLAANAIAFDTRESPYAVGTCDGTGVAINVCLGWYPSFVEIWNLDDTAGTDQFPHVIWFRSMAADTTYDEGILELGDAAAAIFTQSVLTANGISLYAGGTAIYYDKTSARWEAAAGGAGASVEELYVDGFYQRSASTSAAYQCYGKAVAGSTPAQDTGVVTAKGFTIGTNANLNVDGEQLFWIAYR